MNNDLQASKITFGNNQEEIPNNPLQNISQNESLLDVPDSNSNSSISNKFTLPSNIKEEKPFKSKVIYDQHTYFEISLKIYKEENTEKLTFTAKEILPKAHVPFFYRNQFTYDDLTKIEKAVKGCDNLQEVKGHFAELIRNDLIKLKISKDYDVLELHFEITFWCQTHLFTLPLKRIFSDDEERKKEDLRILYKNQKKLFVEYKKLYKKYQDSQVENIKKFKITEETKEYDFEFIKDLNLRFQSGNPLPIYIKLKNVGKTTWEKSKKIVVKFIKSGSSVECDDCPITDEVKPGAEIILELDAKFS